MGERVRTGEAGADGGLDDDYKCAARAGSILAARATTSRALAIVSLIVASGHPLAGRTVACVDCCTLDVEVEVKIACPLLANGENPPTMPT